jgi:ribulose-5-phosphate 4-epimerase/fuculose-1-phosphate aldolase
MPNSKNSTVDRRDFLKSAAAGAAVLVSSPGLAEPQRSETASTAPAATPHAADILKMKEKVALATRMLAREGIVGSSGHVSMRIPGTDHVLIGPEDVTRNILGPDDVVTVDLNTNQIEGKHHRPDETEIHTGIYRARPDVMAVVHTHPTYSVSFSITKKPILPVHMHGAIFADGVNVFDSVGHVNTHELGDGLARALGNRRAVLMKMHGAAIVGATLEEAFVAAFQLEENAQQQLLAEATGKVEPMTPEDVARCIKQSWRPSSIQKRWQYYLDKQSLDYKA